PGPDGPLRRRGAPPGEGRSFEPARRAAGEPGVSGAPTRVLVTGASGVFGREITGRLVRAGHDVVTLSRRRPVGLPAGVTHVAADIRDVEAVTRAVDGCGVVAHCAWVVNALAGQEGETRSVNLDGTATV